MIIELLKFTCPPEMRDAFVRRDAEVWTQALARHPGFIGKEVWTDLATPDQLTLVIRWRSLADWRSFPVELRETLDVRMGNLWLAVDRCEAYEVGFG